MRKSTLIIATAITAAVFSAGWWLGTARAQEPQPRPTPDNAYVYVGLNNNVARIDPATGRIWVLKVAAGVDRRAGVNDIVTYPQHPWRWTEVLIVGTRAGAESEPAGTPTEEGDER